MTAQRAKVRRAISLPGQYAALDEVQTGAENLRMMGRLSGLGVGQARARADELLRQFDLVAAGRRQVGTYSGGMRRRVDLAAGLAARPRVIFLDEPTTGLDLPGRQALWATITGLAADGITIFLTTQYLEEADRLADRIAVLAEGRLAAEGTAAQLKQRVAGHRLDLHAAGPAAFAELAAAPAKKGRPTRPRSPSPCPPTAARRTSAPCSTGSTRPATWSATSPCTAPPSTTCSSPSPAMPRPPPLPPAPPPLLPSKEIPPMSDSLAMTARGLRLTIRKPDALFTGLTLPPLIMLVFVYLFGGAMDTGTRYVTYVVPGVLVFGAFLNSATTSVTVCQDMTGGIIDRFRSMNVPGTAIVGGHVLASTARFAIAVVLMLAVGYGIGFRGHATAAGALAAAGMLLLFAFAISWLCAVIGLAAKTAGSGQLGHVLDVAAYERARSSRCGRCRCGCAGLPPTSRFPRSPRRSGRCCSASPPELAPGRPPWPGPPASPWCRRPPPRPCSGASPYA